MTTDPLTPQYHSLDCSLLGRPVHLLPVFAAQLRDDLEQSLRLPGNRRYWAGFQVQDAGFSLADGSEPKMRWLRTAAAAGDVGFALERSLLLDVLNCRYGRGAALVAQDLQVVPVTATEERLALTLARQLVGPLLRRVDLNLAPMAGTAGAETTISAGVAPSPGTWLLNVTICHVSTGRQGRLWFAPDQPLMISVLRGLQPPHATAARKNFDPLAARLQLTLTGCLVNKEVLLGSLFDLRVGDIIPISLDRTDVLLDESRLFTAVVNEHKGKLCLTSFEDAD